MRRSHRGRQIHGRLSDYRAIRGPFSFILPAQSRVFVVKPLHLGLKQLAKSLQRLDQLRFPLAQPLNPD